MILINTRIENGNLYTRAGVRFPIERTPRSSHVHQVESPIQMPFHRTKLVYESDPGNLTELRGLLRRRLDKESVHQKLVRAGDTSAGLLDSRTHR